MLGVKGLISYEGQTGHELETDFKEAIDTYRNDRRQDGIAPEKLFKGSFNVRISPKPHQRAALLVMEDKVSLNNFVTVSIRERIVKETWIHYW